MRLLAILGTCSLSLFLLGCGTLRPAGVSPDGSVSAGASSLAPDPSHTAAEPRPSDLDPRILHAIEMRRSLGIRADIEYVVASMTDRRASVTILDFPTYPDEDAKLAADQADQDRAVTVIQEYGAGLPDEFGGLYIDRDEHPGVVTMLWTDHLADHARIVRERLDGGFVIARQVRYSQAHLQALVDAMSADMTWTSAIPAAFQGLGVDTIKNVIVLDVSSAEPTAVQQILDHYALGDRLAVSSDGTGAALIPAGTVDGLVIGPDGRPADPRGGLDVRDEPGAPGSCGGGDMGFGVADDGTFKYPCQAGPRVIVIMKNVADGEWKVIGRAKVMVAAGGTTKVTIHLTEMP
jgi:hypothetical protein